MYVIQVVPLKVNKTPLSLTCSFSLPPPSCFLPPTKLPKEESELAMFSSCITHSLLGVMRRSPMTPKCHIHGAFSATFPSSCHWPWPLLNAPSSLHSLASAMTLAPWTSADHSDHPFSVPYSPSSFAHVLMLVNPRFYPWSTSFPIAYVLSRYSSTVTYLEAEELPICISSLDLSSEL